MIPTPMLATLWRITALFGSLSLLAFGGGNGVIPAMRRAAVEADHWVTDRQFLDLFAISRAAPGPGSLIVVLLGQRAAGLPGAAAAAIGMYVPACLLVYGAARVWRSQENAAWRQAAERALAPVAIGLTFGSGIAIARGTVHGIIPTALILASTAVLSLTGLNPLPVMAVAGVITAALH